MSSTVDRIELAGIRAVGTIGVLPEEQARPQPFEIDLVLEVDAREAGRTDDLERSVDYGVAIGLGFVILGLLTLRRPAPVGLRPEGAKADKA